MQITDMVGLNRKFALCTVQNYDVGFDSNIDRTQLKSGLNVQPSLRTYLAHPACLLGGLYHVLPMFFCLFLVGDI